MPDESGEGFGGSYPGGPRRGRSEEVRREPRLERVDQIEARMGRARARRLRSRRARRVRIGFVLALLVSGGIGLAVGWLSHRSTEDIAREREEARLRSSGRDASQEVNRVLLELWRMEDIEHRRNQGR